MVKFSHLNKLAVKNAVMLNYFVLNYVLMDFCYSCVGFVSTDANKLAFRAHLQLNCQSFHAAASQKTHI